jgi:hypothetical protein
MNAQRFSIVVQTRVVDQRVTRLRGLQPERMVRRMQFKFSYTGRVAVQVATPSRLTQYPDL